MAVTAGSLEAKVAPHQVDPVRIFCLKEYIFSFSQLITLFYVTHKKPYYHCHLGRGKFKLVLCGLTIT